MKKITQKIKKIGASPIKNIIQTNQKKGKNTTIQLNTTQILLEPSDNFTIHKKYLIIGEKQEPETIINTDNIIFITGQ